MKSSRQIQTELDTLMARRDTLISDLVTAQEKHNKTQQRFVAGEAKASQLAEATAAVNALESARQLLDREIEALQTELAAAQETEHRQCTAARLQEIHEERNEVTAEYYKLRDELNEVLASYGEKFLANSRRWAELYSEASSLGGRPGPHMANRDVQEPYGLAIGETIRIARRTEERERGKERSRLRKVA